MLTLIQFHWIEFASFLVSIALLFYFSRTRIIAWFISFFFSLSTLLYSAYVVHLFYSTPDEGIGQALAEFYSTHHILTSVFDLNLLENVPYRWSILFMSGLIFGFVVLIALLGCFKSEDEESAAEQNLKAAQIRIKELSEKLSTASLNLKSLEDSKNAEIDEYVRQLQAKDTDYFSLDMQRDKLVCEISSFRKDRDRAIRELNSRTKALNEALIREKRHLGQIHRLAKRKEAYDELKDLLIEKEILSEETFKKVMHSIQTNIKIRDAQNQ